VPEKFGQCCSTRPPRRIWRTRQKTGTAWISISTRGGMGSPFKVAPAPGREHADNCDLRAVNPYLGTNTQSGSAAPSRQPSTRSLRRTRIASSTNHSCGGRQDWRRTRFPSGRAGQRDVAEQPGSQPGVATAGRHQRGAPCGWCRMRRAAGPRPSALGGRSERHGEPDPVRDVFKPRVNQFDFRVAKILRFGRRGHSLARLLQLHEHRYRRWTSTRPSSRVDSGMVRPSGDGGTVHQNWARSSTSTSWRRAEARD
jgi:hypothetical protein